MLAFSSYGGEGAILDLGSKFHDDCRLVAMAVKKRWPISEEMKQRLIDRLATAAIDNPDDDIAIKAANVLKSMEQQNQKDEQIATVQSDRNRFLEIAQRLGIAQRVERITGSGAGDSVTVIDGESRAIGGEQGRSEETGHKDEGG